MKTKKLTRLALLTTLALIIFLIEARIPNPFPIPGIKLGLANIITVYAMFQFSAGEVAMILFGRILLGGIFSGSLISLLFSITGGLFCYCAMLLMRRIVSQEQIWVCSVIGSMAHNLGQILAAACLAQTFSVFLYLPPLLIAGICAGAFTGFLSQFVVSRLKKT